MGSKDPIVVKTKAQIKGYTHNLEVNGSLKCQAVAGFHFHLISDFNVLKQFSWFIPIWYVYIYNIYIYGYTFYMANP